MKVKELREALQRLEAELAAGGMEVLFSHTSGDYWRTQVADAIEYIAEGVVTHSEYHSTDKVVEVDYDDEGECTPNPEHRQVILIS